ncbi:MAG: sulfite exporter TauE/SafE family protein [Candidatus Kerfeldbacteria bacterium]|nr:sulfite exporter TauE/SafE family protein [Candidatus Kerfeldbacteria bacterium]
MFDFIQVAAAEGNVSLGVAFLAGAITFLSPCILPIVPSYLSYVVGVSTTELKQTNGQRRWAVVWYASLFVLGFIAVFMVLGLVTGTIGGWLALYKTKLQVVGGILLVLFGLHMLEVFKFSWLYKQVQPTTPRKISRWQSLNAVLIGTTFGLSWTPCVGPILASILFLATFSGGSTQGVLLLLMFALGLAVPFLLIAFFLQKLLPLLKRFSKYLVWIHRLAGVVILLIGLALLTGTFNYISGYFMSISQPLL